MPVPSRTRAVIPQGGHRFAREMMLQHHLDRDDDSKKSHHASAEHNRSRRNRIGTGIMFFVIVVDVVSFGCDGHIVDECCQK
jgi:hypothetical protein